MTRSRRFLRSLVVVNTLTWLLLASQTGLAELKPATPAEESRITLSLSDATLSVGLKRVFEQARVRYEVDQQIAPLTQVVRVSADFQDVDFNAAVNALLTANWGKAPLQQVAIRDAKGSLRSVRIQGVPISVDLVNEPLDRALHGVFAQLSFDYAYSPDAVGSRPISLQLQEVPFTSVIDQLLTRSEFGKDLSLRCEHGIFYIARKNWTPEVRRLKLECRFRFSPLRPSLAAFFRSWGQSFVSRDLEGWEANIDLPATPLRSALESVLRCAQPPGGLSDPLTYRVEGGIFIVSRRGRELDYPE